MRNKTWLPSGYWKMWSWTLLLVGSFVLSGASQAAEIDNLYGATIGVYSQAQNERQQGLQQAFEQTLIKVSGQADIVTRTEVKQALRQVNDYLVQYSYRQNDTDGLQLSASFDPTKVDALLRQLDAPIWGSRRPQLLIWLAQENSAGERDVIGSDNESVLKQQLLNQAQLRGVPVSLPLFDLTDRMRVSVADIWGRFQQPLLRAGERYQADGIVIARVFRNYQMNSGTDQFSATAAGDVTSGQWVFDWQAWIGNERAQGRVYGDDPAFLAAPVIDSLAQQLGETYGIRESTARRDSLAIRVLNLTQVTDILSLENYLRSLAVIERFELRQFGSQQAEYQLQLKVDAGRAEQVLGLDRRLQPISRSPFAAAASMPEFRWQP